MYAAVILSVLVLVHSVSPLPLSLPHHNLACLRAALPASLTPPSWVLGTEAQNCQNNTENRWSGVECRSNLVRAVHLEASSFNSVRAWTLDRAPSGCDGALDDMTLTLSNVTTVELLNFSLFTNLTQIVVNEAVSVRIVGRQHFGVNGSLTDTVGSLRIVNASHSISISHLRFTNTLSVSSDYTALLDIDDVQCLRPVCTFSVVTYGDLYVRNVMLLTHFHADLTIVQLEASAPGTEQQELENATSSYFPAFSRYFVVVNITMSAPKSCDGVIAQTTSHINSLFSASNIVGALCSGGSWAMTVDARNSVNELAITRYMLDDGMFWNHALQTRCNCNVVLDYMAGENLYIAVLTRVVTIVTSGNVTVSRPVFFGGMGAGGSQSFNIVANGTITFSNIMVYSRLGSSTTMLLESAAAISITDVVSKTVSITCTLPCSMDNVRALDQMTVDGLVSPALVDGDVYSGWPSLSMPQMSLRAITAPNFAVSNCRVPLQFLALNAEFLTLQNCAADAKFDDPVVVGRDFASTQSQSPSSSTTGSLPLLASAIRRLQIICILGFEAMYLRNLPTLQELLLFSSGQSSISIWSVNTPQLAAMTISPQSFSYLTVSGTMGVINPRDYNRAVASYRRLLIVGVENVTAITLAHGASQCFQAAAPPTPVLEANISSMPKLLGLKFLSAVNAMQLADAASFYTLDIVSVQGDVLSMSGGVASCTTQDTAPLQQFDGQQLLPVVVGASVTATVRVVCGVSQLQSLRIGTIETASSSVSKIRLSDFPALESLFLANFPNLTQLSMNRVPVLKTLSFALSALKEILVSGSLFCPTALSPANGLNVAYITAPALASLTIAQTPLELLMLDAVPKLKVLALPLGATSIAGVASWTTLTNLPASFCRTELTLRGTARIVAGKDIDIPVTKPLILGSNGLSLTQLDLRNNQFSRLSFVPALLLSSSSRQPFADVLSFTTIDTLLLSDNSLLRRLHIARLPLLRSLDLSRTGLIFIAVSGNVIPAGSLDQETARTADIPHTTLMDSATGRLPLDGIGTVDGMALVMEVPGLVNLACVTRITDFITVAHLPNLERLSFESLLNLTLADLPNAALVIGGGVGGLRFLVLRDVAGKLNDAVGDMTAVCIQNGPAGFCGRSGATCEQVHGNFSYCAGCRSGAGTEWCATEDEATDADAMTCQTEGCCCLPWSPTISEDDFHIATSTVGHTASTTLPVLPPHHTKTKTDFQTITGTYSSNLTLTLSAMTITRTANLPTPQTTVRRLVRNMQVFLLAQLDRPPAACPLHVCALLIIRNGTSVNFNVRNVSLALVLMPGTTDGFENSTLTPCLLSFVPNTPQQTVYVSRMQIVNSSMMFINVSVATKNDFQLANGTLAAGCFASKTPWAGAVALDPRIDDKDGPVALALALEESTTAQSAAVLVVVQSGVAVATLSTGSATLSVLAMRAFAQISCSAAKKRTKGISLVNALHFFQFPGLSNTASNVIQTLVVFICLIILQVILVRKFPASGPLLRLAERLSAIVVFYTESFVINSVSSLLAIPMAEKIIGVLGIASAVAACAVTAFYLTVRFPSALVQRVYTSNRGCMVQIVGERSADLYRPRSSTGVPLCGEHDVDRAEEPTKRPEKMLEKRTTDVLALHVNESDGPDFMQSNLLQHSRFLALFERYRVQRRWFFLFDLVLLVIEGCALAIVRLSDDGSTICTILPWAVAVAYAVQFVTLLALRPYVHRYDNVLHPLIILQLAFVRCPIVAGFPSVVTGVAYGVQATVLLLSLVTVAGTVWKLSPYGYAYDENQTDAEDELLNNVELDAETSSSSTSS